MSGYQVTLDVFEGPLDVLLRLIEGEELDISLVSLALVTDQYLAYTARLTELSASSLADFLMIAARLLVIKSRHLLPQNAEAAPEGDEESDAWGLALVERLKEYQRYKAASARLSQIAQEGRHAYPRLAPAPRPQPRIPHGAMSVEELASAFRRLLEAHAPEPPVDGMVAPLVIRMADCVQTIVAHTRAGRRVAFGALVQRARSRLEIILHFMAVLELVKRGRIVAFQKTLYGEIYLEGCEPELAAGGGAGAMPTADIAPAPPIQSDASGQARPHREPVSE